MKFLQANNKPLFDGGWHLFISMLQWLDGDNTGQWLHWHCSNTVGCKSVVNFELLPRPSEMQVIIHVHKCKWMPIIMDTAHFGKNPQEDCMIKRVYQASWSSCQRYRLYEKVCIQVSGLDQQLNVKKDTRSNIETPKGQYVTSVPKVYAAKDCHHGQSWIVTRKSNMQVRRLRIWHAL